MEHIKITNKDNLSGNGWQGTKVQVGEYEVPGVRSVDFRVAVDEVPTFLIETIANPEIEMEGNVVFKFHPRTINEAACVIRKSFAKGNENYNALVSSIKSIIDEYRPNAENGFRLKEAQDIADRILGIEK